MEKIVRSLYIPWDTKNFSNSNFTHNFHITDFNEI